MSQKVEIEIRLDNKHFAASANTVKAEITAISRHAESEGRKMGGVFDSLGKKVVGAFAVGSLVEFGRKIVEVRSETESLQKSFESLAGEHIGKQLYEEIKQFPAMMNEMSKGAQTLLGFNYEAQKVMPILRQIGDISMGDAQKFNSLTLAFAQMSSTGKLMGQDLLQMINAGFNPLVVISEKTGKSIATLKDEMSKGAITVEMVEDAFKTATSEGGKFYKMLETQSKTMKGAISNAKGAIEEALNDMGEKTEGVMLKGINMVTTLAQNYETIGRVLMQLVATYGSYKAAVIAVTLAEDMLNGKYVMKIRLLRAAAVAQEMLNKAMLKNPYVLVAAGILSLVSTLVIFRNRTDEAAEAQKKLDSAFNDTQAKIASEQKEIDTLFDKLRKAKKGTEEYKQAKQNILDQYGEYLKGLGKEIETLIDVEGAYKRVARAAREATLARGREAALKDANDEYGKRYADNIGKIQEALVSTAGRAKAKQAIKEIQTELRNTGKISEQTMRKIRGMSDDKVKHGWLWNLNFNEKRLSEAIERVDDMFQLDDKKTENTVKNVTKLSEAYKKAEEEYVSAKALVEKMKKNKEAYSENDWTEATKKLKEKKEKYENVGGDPDGKDAKKQLTVAQDKATRRQKLFEADMKQTEEQARQKRELNDALKQLEIAQETNASKREILQIEKDHKDRLDAIDRQTEEWKKAAYKAAEERFNATNTDKKKKFSDTPEGKAGWQAQSLTEEQSKTEKALIETANADYKRIMLERYESQVQAMRDYLKEFGTFQEQKLAIAEEFAEKIREAQEAENDTEVLRLKAEQLRQETQVDINAIKQSVDWGSVFGEFGAMFKEQLEPTLEKLRQITESDAFKETSYEGQQVVFDLIDKLNQSAAAFDGDIFVKLSDTVTTYQEKMQDLIAAQDDEKEAIENLKEAQAKLDKAKNDGGSEAITKYSEEVDRCTERQREASNNVKECATAANKATTDMRNASDKAKAMFTELASGIHDLTSGSLEGIGNGLMTLDKLFNNGNVTTAVGNALAKGFTKIFGKDSTVVKSLSEALGSSGTVGAIISAILSILDILKEGLGTLIADLIDTILSAVNGILDNILSGKFIEQIVVTLVKGIGNILNTITRAIGNVLTLGAADGGIVDWLGLGGADYSGYEALKEKYEKLLDVWDELIDRKSEYIKMSYGSEIAKVTEETLALIDKEVEAWKKLGVERLNSGASSGSHSIGRRMVNNMSSENWEQIAKGLGWSVETTKDFIGTSRMTGLFDLTGEQLQKVKEASPEFWAKMDGDVRDYLEKIIKAGDQTANAIKAAQERLTTTTAEQVKDDFLNIMYDMADGVEDATEDIGDNWQKMINRMVVNNLIMKDFEKDLESWYERLAGLQDLYNKGAISPEQYKADLAELNAEYNGYVDSAQQKINTFTEMGIIQPIDTKDAETSLKNLRDLYRETLLDMESDSEAFRKKLSQILAEDLLNSQVFDVKMTVNGKDFENFDAYAKDWNQRYADALKADDEAALDALIDELVEQQAILQEAAENIRERLKETQEDTTFKDMADSWTSTLMDMTKTAEDWAQDIGRTMAEKIISQMVAPTMMQPLLDKLQEAFNTAMGADGATWKSVMADGGVLAALGAIKDAYPELQEVVKQIMEALGVTVNEEVKEGFSDLKGTIISALMDSEGDIKKFAADLGKGMVEQMVKAMTDQKYGEQIKALNEEWSEALESGDPARIEAIKQKVLELYAAIGNDEEIKKLLDDIRELGASNPFDNLQDSFLSTLMNMEGSADDFVKDLKKKLAEALVNDIVIGKDFADKLEYYKEQYKRIMGDPSLSDEERAKAIRDLADTWREYTEGKKHEADEINKWLGTYEHEDQQATMNMANAATYDQYELSLGMQTSQLMVAEQTKGLVQQILDNVRSVKGVTQPGKDYQEMIFMRLGTTNEYLLAMKKATESIKEEVVKHLGAIDVQTSRL